MSTATTILFYDGENPFWVRHVQFLKCRNTAQRLHFANIASRKFDARIFDKTEQELRSDIHGLLTDGTWLTGVDLLRHTYVTLGYGGLVVLSRVPILKQLIDFGYRVYVQRSKSQRSHVGTDHSAESHAPHLRRLNAS